MVRCRRADKAHRIIGEQELDERPDCLFFVGPEGLEERSRPGPPIITLDAVMGDHVVVVVNDSGHCPDRSMIGSCRGQVRLGVTLFEEVTLVVELLEQRAAGVHEPDMRAVGLVGGVQVHITVERLDVGESVRRERHTVDDDVTPHGMEPISQVTHRVDRGGDVGRMGHREQAGALADHVVEIGGIEQPGCRVDSPFPHHDAGVGQTPPGATIGLVILVGDDDLVTVVPHRAHRPGQHIGVLAGGRPEMDLVFGGVEQLRHHRPRSPHRFGRHHRRTEPPLRLTLAVGEQVSEQVDDLARAVAAARVFQMGPLPGLGVGEGGKLATDEVEVEGRHVGTLAVETAASVRRRWRSR